MKPVGWKKAKYYSPQLHEEIGMTALSRRAWLPLNAAFIIAVCTFGMDSSLVFAAGIPVTLTGDQEVPPIKSKGSGSGTITIGADHTVSGSIITTGIAGTMAHIHEAPPGKSGPVVIPLTKDGNTYTVPPDAKLSDAQYTSLLAGNLYVNVHTAAHPDGEIRGQLKP
jgi:hypothetical protein